MNVTVPVCSPFAYMDPLSTNLTHLFCQLYQDALTEYTYAAELAGLGYNIHNTIYGLIVSSITVVVVHGDYRVFTASVAGIITFVLCLHWNCSTDHTATQTIGHSSIDISAIRDT